MDELITQFWKQLVALMGFVVWLIRLEGKVKINSKDINTLQELREEDLKRAETSRAETNKKIDNLHHSQERHFESLREDIRSLKRE